MKENKLSAICLPLLISITCMVCGIVFCSLLGRVLPKETQNQIYIRDIVPRVVTALGLIWFMQKAYKSVELGFVRKGFLKGMAVSFLMDIYIAINFIDGASVKTVRDFAKIPIETYLLCFLSTLAIGLFEEVLLRGTVLNILKAHLGEWKYATYVAVASSSLLFGLVHMINYFSGNAYLRPTIAQVFYATSLGLFLGAVYVRCKNLWVVILLHGLFDFAAEFWDLVTPNYDFSKQDISWGDVGYLICSYLPLALAAAYITWRAVKEEQEQKRRE